MRLRRSIVLIYRAESAQIQTIRRICLPMGIQILQVLPEQERLPLGFLAGLEGMPLTLTPEEASSPEVREPEDVAADPPERTEPEDIPADAAKLTEPMVVFGGFTNEMLDHFLAKSRKMQLGIRLKAMLTPTNARWNGRQLQQELKREREAFRKRT